MATIASVELEAVDQEGIDQRRRARRQPGAVEQFPRLVAVTPVRDRTQQRRRCWMTRAGERHAERVEQEDLGGLDGGIGQGLEACAHDQVG